MEDNNKTTQGAVTPTTPTNEANGGTKTFSQDEVNAILSERLKEQKSKNEQAIKDAITEYERQAKLSEEEREKEAKSKREAELLSREQEVTLRERKLEAQEMLQAKNIPISLVEFVIDLDAEKTKENIEKLATTYCKSVEDGVTDKLKGTPPKDFSNSNNNADEKKKISTAF